MTAFDASALVKAWEAHDRFCYSLTPPDESSRKTRRLPYNGGVDTTNRLLEEQHKAAAALGIDTVTLVAIVMAERRADPGPDVAGAIARVVAGLTLSTQHCSRCGVEMPNYQIYRDFHAEHCPEIGPQRAEPIKVEIVDMIEGML